MNGGRPKLCEKKHRTAELKCLKLISKIELLKLNNSFVAKLELPHKVQMHSEFKQYFKYIRGAAVVALLGIILSWIFNQFYTEKVSFFSIVNILAMLRKLFRIVTIGRYISI